MDSGSSGSIQSSCVGGGGEDGYNSRAPGNSDLPELPSIPPLLSDHQQSPFHYLNTNFSSFQLPISIPSHPRTLDWSNSPPVTNSNFTELSQILASSQSNIDSIRTSSHRSDQKNSSNPPRTTRKRSRVSKRAPTTVLATDVSNFRAMVQEFTGIPSTPFSKSGCLDFFATAGSAMRSSSFPLRPLPQKLVNPNLPSHPPPSVDASATASSLSSIMDLLNGSSNSKVSSVFADDVPFFCPEAHSGMPLAQNLDLDVNTDHNCNNNDLISCWNNENEGIYFSAFQDKDGSVSENVIPSCEGKVDSGICNP